jgi:hypothetical protein
MTLVMERSLTLAPGRGLAGDPSEVAVTDSALFDVPLASLSTLIVYAEARVGTLFLMGALAVAVWGVADYLQGQPRRDASRACSPCADPPLRTLFVIAAVSSTVPLMLGLTGCGPRFYHLDGRPFTPLLRPMSLDHGWIAVDSSVGGVHALVEIQVEVPDAQVRPLDLERVAFRFATSDRWTPGHVRAEGPFCPLQGRNGSGESRPGTQRDGSVNPVTNTVGLRCTYTVRAEFQLDRRPVPGDSVVVVYGRRVTHLAWQ